MSLDIIDDLHAAEERIGALTAALDELIRAVRDEHRGRYVRMAEALERADTALGASWCRPSCDDCDPDDCGCPAHGEGEPHRTPACPRCDDDGYLDTSTQTDPRYCDCPAGIAARAAGEHRSRP